MRRLLLCLMFSVPSMACAFDMGSPPSVLAEAYGNNAAELGACGGGQAQIVKYLSEAEKRLGAKSKKPIDMANNKIILENSYREQAARYAAGTEAPHCDDLVSRITLR